MSDSSESDYSPLPTTNLPVVPKKKRVITEKQRAVLLISATKARAAKAAKRKALDDAEAENANILRQVLEREKSKKAEVVVVAAEQEPVKPKRKSKKPEPKPQSDSEEDSESDASASESDSNDEAEFVLTRSKHDKPKKKTSAEVSILEEMLRMKAELAALKLKQKSPKVNVYVNNAEKKKDLSTQKKKALMDL